MSLESKAISPVETRQTLPIILLTPFIKGRILLLDDMLGQLPDYEKIVRDQEKFDLNFETISGKQLHILVDATFLRGLRSAVLSFYMDLQNEGMGDVAQKLVSSKVSGPET